MNGKAPDQAFESDFINRGQRRQPRPESMHARLGLQISLLEQVKNAGDKAEEQRRVSDKNQSNVDINPLGAYKKWGRRLGWFGIRRC